MNKDKLETISNLFEEVSELVKDERRRKYL